MWELVDIFGKGNGDTSHGDLQTGYIGTLENLVVVLSGPSVSTWEKTPSANVLFGDANEALFSSRE